MAADLNTVCCAIYTRKSTDEGLEQSFNTLDAQREAAENYIRARKSDGWLALAKRYDDGGFSGATMDRPAFRELLTDIEAGQVDCVVVYKIDRLTRSLADFSRILEIFNRTGVSFLSVTQQFSTTDPAGTLMLNVLLSFSQFERELIAERTRDKMAAARRKGKWVGGSLVLGYDIARTGGALAVNEAEAERVREIFRLYLEYGALRPVVEELRRRDWRLKSWISQTGRPIGGSPFTKTTLHNLLTNIVYTGRVRYKGQIYAGEHAAIIDEKTWNRVQQKLNRNGRRGGRNTPNRYGALLKGLVRCESCNTAMTHTYTSKGPTIYRYYVCHRAHQQGWNTCPARSVSAPELETAVIEQIRGVSLRPELLARMMEQLRADGKADVSVSEVYSELEQFDSLWEQLRIHEQEQFIRLLVREVRYDGRDQTVNLAFHTPGLKELAQGAVQQ
jgi:site-specific DNA recombinase